MPPRMMDTAWLPLGADRHSGGRVDLSLGRHVILLASHGLLAFVPRHSKTLLAHFRSGRRSSGKSPAQAACCGRRASHMRSWPFLDRAASMSRWL